MRRTVSVLLLALASALLLLALAPSAHAAPVRCESAQSCAAPDGATVAVIQQYARLFQWDGSQFVVDAAVSLVSGGPVSVPVSCPEWTIPDDPQANVMVVDSLAYCEVEWLYSVPPPEPPASGASGADAVPASTEQLLVVLLGVAGWCVLIFGFNTGRGFV